MNLGLEGEVVADDSDEVFMFKLIAILILVNPMVGHSAVESDIEGLYHISRFLSPKGAVKTLVMVDGGRKDGVVDGAVFEVFRQQSPENLRVSTGMLKAVEVHEDFTIAEVTHSGSAISEVLFPKFASVMEGDFVKEKKMVLAKVRKFVPQIEIAFDDLFEDPKADPKSFEISEDGYARLKATAAKFADFRVSKLFIEGHTDGMGPADANQIESYQRALTIRQYLVTELQFDPKRVVAVGFGESELKERSFVPGHRGTNRRIIFKVMGSDP